MDRKLDIHIQHPYSCFSYLYILNPEGKFDGDRRESYKNNGNYPLAEIQYGAPGLM